MPKQYIYEPWSAPIEVQKKAKCIIGVDYPRPCQFLFSHLMLNSRFSNVLSILQYHSSFSTFAKCSHIGEILKKSGVGSAVVDHTVANKECRERMGAAYALHKEVGGLPQQEQVDALHRRLDETLNNHIATNETTKKVPKTTMRKTVGTTKGKDTPSSKRQRKLTDYK